MDQSETLKKRVASLEAALERLLRMTENQWVGPEEGAIYRSCRAILEDQSWRK